MMKQNGRNQDPTFREVGSKYLIIDHAFNIHFSSVAIIIYESCAHFYFFCRKHVHVENMETVK